MTAGIRAEISVSDPGDCPIADVSRGAQSPVRHVSTSVANPESASSVSDCLVAGPPRDREDVTAVFEYGDGTLYRTSHGPDPDCPCACLGRFDCLVHGFVAADGELSVVFHADGYETLQGDVGDLRRRFPSFEVHRLLQSLMDTSPDEHVFVNLGRLTDKQYEALQTAYEADYFKRPKGANASEIAAEMGISRSTFTEHIVTAQRKLLKDIIQ